MRRIVLLVGPLAAALFAFACEDDPSNPGTPFPEAGTFDTNQPPPIDGSVPDATADADAAQPPQPVSVVVANRKGPRAGIVVVFHDAAGAVLETKTTDATGRATSNAAGPIPAMATALLGKDVGERELLTWTGVEAGDELFAADPEESLYLGSYAVTLPSLLTDAGATDYQVYLGNCGGSGDGTVPISVSIYSSCAGALNAPIVTATDNGGAALSHAFKKNVPPPADGGVTNVDALTGWTTDNTFTVSVLNKPGVVGPTARLLEIANNLATPNYSAFALDGSDQAKFKTAPGYADAYQASVSAPGTANGTTRRLTTRFASGTTSGTFDFQQALPELQTATIDETDKLRPTVSWSSVASLAGTDGGILRARFILPSESSVRWTIVVPPGGTSGSAKAPALPPVEAAGFLPDADSGPNTWQGAEAIFAEADALADYKAFRKTNGIVIQAVGSPEGFLPANGSFKTTEIQSQGL